MSVTCFIGGRRGPLLVADLYFHMDGSYSYYNSIRCSCLHDKATAAAAAKRKVVMIVQLAF